MARAYLRPLRGVDEAGEGGRSWPSRSSFRINLLGPEPLPLPLPEARGSEDGVVIVVAAKDTLAAKTFPYAQFDLDLSQWRGRGKSSQRCYLKETDGGQEVDKSASRALGGLVKGDGELSLLRSVLCSEYEKH